MCDFVSHNKDLFNKLDKFINEVTDLSIFIIT